MEIDNERVASIHYTLTDDAGEVIDQSPADTPLTYLHGAGNIVPGLEKALIGKQVGDRVNADVVPEEGYGPHHERLVQTLPRSAFQGIDAVEAGMRFQAKTERGPMVVTVTRTTPDDVTVDGNHPLAGKTLHFAVEVADIRDATAEEKEEGHVAA